MTYRNRMATYKAIHSTGAKYITDHEDHDRFWFLHGKTGWTLYENGKYGPKMVRYATEEEHDMLEMEWRLTK